MLITQGQAYARMGRIQEARECFEMGLKVNSRTLEANLIEAELNKLPKQVPVTTSPQ